MAKITWANKIALIITGLAHINVWKDADANELKGGHDNHDERLDALEQGLINEVVNVSAIWIPPTGLVYNVSADNFGGAEGGKSGYFSATPDTVTLTVADGSDERIDRIGVFYPVSPSVLGVVGKIDGIPGSGIAEDYDPTLFFHIRFATVEALATSPKDTSRETIYIEDAGEPGEWVASDNTANIVQDSTNDPDVGTVSIEGTNVVKGDKNIFTHSTTFSTGFFDLLTYRTKLKISMGNSSWNIKFFNSTTQIGRTYRFKGGQNNFDSSDVAAYQSVRIDFAKLNLPVADFDIIEIYPEKSFTGYFIDEVYLHRGSGNGNIVAGVEEAPEDGNLYARINAAWQSITLGVGDMILAGVQTVTGAKTFEDGKLLMRNVADTFSSLFTNTNTAARTYTWPDKDITVAGLDDLDGVIETFGSLVTWTFNHGLGNQYPDIKCIDTLGFLFIPYNIEYTTVNQAIITHTIAKAGKATANGGTGGAGGRALDEQVAYATALVFVSNKVSTFGDATDNQHTQSGTIVFTYDFTGAIEGSIRTLEILGDGNTITVPTYIGKTRSVLNNSATMLDAANVLTTTAATNYLLSFWYTNGYVNLIITDLDSIE